MELIIAVIIIIGTVIVFCKVTDETSTKPSFASIAPPKYWATGTRYLVGDFITEAELEEMRKKVNSKDSKF